MRGGAGRHAAGGGGAGRAPALAHLWRTALRRRARSPCCRSSPAAGVAPLASAFDNPRPRPLPANHHHLWRAACAPSAGGPVPSVACRARISPPHNALCFTYWGPRPLQAPPAVAPAPLVPTSHAHGLPRCARSCARPLRPVPYDEINLTPGALTSALGPPDQCHAPRRLTAAPRKNPATRLSRAAARRPTPPRGAPSSLCACVWALLTGRTARAAPFRSLGWADAVTAGAPAAAGSGRRRLPLGPQGRRELLVPSLLLHGRCKAARMLHAPHRWPPVPTPHPRTNDQKCCRQRGPALRQPDFAYQIMASYAMHLRSATCCAAVTHGNRTGPHRTRLQPRSVEPFLPPPRLAPHGTGCRAGTAPGRSGPQSLAQSPMLRL